MTGAQREVLIVEDEVLIGMVLEDMLDMLGHRVVANCASMDEAETAVAAGAFNLAIVDVNIGTDPIFPIADRLIAAGVPLVFATGSSSASLPEKYRGFPVLEKPYAFSAVEAVLAAIPAV